ncbi:MAG: hypothetical protein IT196_10715 [Acidimicrobiales bacterium]|nr:hypothetical protein [Acidimicrobiales bacterium]
MLLDAPTLDAIAAGTVDVVFRCWRRPTVRSGGTLRTPVGMLAIIEVAPVEPGAITDTDAARAGFPDAAAVRRFLAEGGCQPPGGDPEGGAARRAYRIELGPGGPDPRTALQQDDELDGEQLAGLLRRLDRLDRSGANGPWTAATLHLIARRPAVRAADLAGELGRDRDAFKTDVRKLKALGLTISLEVGYRLSPRGERVRAVLARDHT